MEASERDVQWEGTIDRHIILIRILLWVNFTIILIRVSQKLPSSGGERDKKRRAMQLSLLSNYSCPLEVTSSSSVCMRERSHYKSNYSIV